MNCRQALQILAKLKPELVERIGVTRLALFGSTVRDEAGVDSETPERERFDRSGDTQSA
jgi:predicted nucleotidyltransferase